MKIQIVLILFILFLVGCANYSDKKNFTIDLDIQDTTRKEIAIGYKKNIGLSSVTEYIPVKSKDSIQFVIDSINQPFTAYINIDEIQLPIWVEPNSNLNIVFAKDTIFFSGKSKIFADYYLKSRKYWTGIYNGYEIRNPVLEGRPSGFEYFNVQDSITIDRLNFLESFFANQNTSSTKQFIEHEKITYFIRTYFTRFQD